MSITSSWNKRLSSTRNLRYDAVSGGDSLQGVDAYITENLSHTTVTHSHVEDRPLVAARRCLVSTTTGRKAEARLASV